MTVRTGNWYLDQVLAGNAYQVTVGSLSTPIQGGGEGTVLDLDQSELRVAVPTGTAIIPTRIAVDCHTPLLAADADESEILIAVDRTQAITDGTDTLETSVNKRTDAPKTSGCTVSSATTVDHTDPVLGMELSHDVITADSQTAAGVLWGQLKTRYEPKDPPVIVGPATLLVYWGGTVATTGFCSVEWIERASTDLTT